MFAYDRGWIRKIEEAIRNGLTAEAAVEKVQSDTRARMLRQTDPYLRERLHDLDDLAHRLIRELMGREHGPGLDELPQDAIVVGRNMGAAELLDYGRDRIRGLVLEEGGPTSHVTIVARALGIPTSDLWMISSAWPMAATRSSWMATPAKCTCARPPIWKTPMRKKSASVRGDRPSTGACATSRPSRGTVSTSRFR